MSKLSYEQMLHFENPTATDDVGLASKTNKKKMLKKQSFQS